MSVLNSRIPKYLFLLFLLAILAYAYFESRNMLYGPQIHLATTGAITVHEQRIAITGTVKNVVAITLSGNPVPIDLQGKFTQVRLLSKGLNRLSFEAIDKFGRTKKEVLEVVYTPKTTPKNPTSNIYTTSVASTSTSTTSR